MCLTGETDLESDREMSDLIIYELHVRGFTKHPSSNVKHGGTFEGLKEKIPYLKELGINAVELMPVFEFDETINAREVTGTRFWSTGGIILSVTFRQIIIMRHWMILRKKDGS